MKIICKTNIDNYKTIQSCFPENLQFVPRIGENVMVKESYIKHFESKRLPTKLIVVGVTYKEDYVIIDLHYSKTDIEMAKVCNINLWG